MAQPLSCPRCQAEMNPVAFGGIEIDRCVACGGLWFDALEKERLAAMSGSEVIDTEPSRTPREPSQEKLHCPRCTSPLLRMVDAQQTHVWYEHCAVCNGNYFDAGEFRDLKETTLLDLVKRMFRRALP